VKGPAPLPASKGPAALPPPKTQSGTSAPNGNIKPPQKKFPPRKV
jgi:hypothetical protein